MVGTAAATASPGGIPLGGIPLVKPFNTPFKTSIHESRKHQVVVWYIKLKKGIRTPESKGVKYYDAFCSTKAQDQQMKALKLENSATGRKTEDERKEWCLVLE